MNVKLILEKLEKMADSFAERNFLAESQWCRQSIVRIAKNSVETDPYDGVNQPMSPLSYMEEECDHNFDAEECPVCGKRLTD